MRATLLLLGLCGCATANVEAPMTVAEVRRNVGALDGQAVLVTGWLAECRGLNCTLWPSVPDPKASGIQAPSIGRRDWFDRSAADHAPGRITFRARVHHECIDVDAVCLGRPEMLEPLSRPHSGVHIRNGS